jgi:hypothetical protein
VAIEIVGLSNSNIKISPKMQPAETDRLVHVTARVAAESARQRNTR